eukprot:gene7159-biopygen4769
MDLRTDVISTYSRAPAATSRRHAPDGAPRRLASAAAHCRRCPPVPRQTVPAATAEDSAGCGAAGYYRRLR